MFEPVLHQSEQLGTDIFSFHLTSSLVGDLIVDIELLKERKKRFNREEEEKASQSVNPIPLTNVA